MIDILLPVFNAFDDMVSCIDSLLAHTDPVHRIVVLDDASADHRIGSCVEQLAASHRQIIYDRAPQNLGLVGNLNRALHRSDNDVVLLNSDTVVTAGWLDAMTRCRDSSAALGIICPLSNNATILSVPAFNADNPLPAGMSADHMAELVKSCSRRDYPRIPTAVGFCMLVTRQAIVRLGGFDPAFGGGYGEECDYSMRAWRSGIEIACCDDAYVFHRGRASFGNDAAIDAARAGNETLMNQRWPGYIGAVQAFCAENPLRELQQALKARLLLRADPQAASRPHVLQLLHLFGSVGGVEQHVQDLAGGLAAELRFTVMHPVSQADHWVDFSEPQPAESMEVVRWNPRSRAAPVMVAAFPAELDMAQAKSNLARYLAGSDVQIVHVQHFANWRNFEIPAIAKQLGKKVVITLHDYHLLCPNYNLLLPWSLKSCQQPILDLEAEICRKCMDSLVHPSAPLSAAYSARRRSLVEAALAAADAIIAPSEFVKAACVRAHGDRFGERTGASLEQRIRVIHHGIPDIAPARHAHDPKVLRVAYFGNLNLSKGAELLIETVSQLRDAPIRFAIHGRVDHVYRPALQALGVRMSGDYRREQISARLADTDAALILSIVDESFCLAVSEAQAAGVPVIAPRAGGITERIRDGETGFLFDTGDAVGLRTLLRKFAAGRSALEQVRRELRSNRPKSLSAMLAEYRKLYLELSRLPTPPAIPRIVSETSAPGFIDEFRFPANPDALGDNAFGDWLAWRDQLCAETRSLRRSDLRPLCMHWLVLTDASNFQWIDRSIASIRDCVGLESIITILSIDADNAITPPTAADNLHIVDSQGKLDAFLSTLNNGTAEWIAILPAGDQVRPDLAAGICQLTEKNPQCDVIYCDEDRVTLNGQQYLPFFKPAADLQWAMSAPYTGRFACCRRSLLPRLALPWQQLSMAAYAALVAAMLDGGSSRVGHLTGIHHHALDIPGNRSGDRLQDAALILHAQLKRQGVDRRVDIDRQHGYYRVLPLVAYKPGVSIIVASGDAATLERCLHSLLGHTDYPDFEVVAVLAGTQNAGAIESLVKRAAPVLSLHRIAVAASHAAALQFGCERARKELLILLSDATIASGAAWLDEFASAFAEADVGLVGGRIDAPRQGIHAAGLLLGCGASGISRYAYLHRLHHFPGALAPRQFSALPGDYLGVRAALLMELGGLDSRNYGNEYWPIDLCLRAGEAGYRVCWTPRLSMASSGLPSMLAGMQPAERAQLEKREREAMFAQWRQQLVEDCARNPCLSIAPVTAGIPDCDGVLALQAIAPDRPPATGLMVFPYDDWGSGNYRARLPAAGLKASGKARVKIMGNHDSGIAATPPELWRFAANSLLLHNFLHDYQLEALALFRKHGNARLVFGMDDLLTELPDYNPYHRTIYADINSRLASALALCDRLIVSTAALANHFQPMIVDIRVVPNYLDEQHWRIKPASVLQQARGRLRVGWSGAKQHLGDLRMLIDVVKNTCGKVDWIFFGMCPPEIVPYATEVHDMVGFKDYPQRLADLALDLAVAPLVDNAFNRAKSNLKILEHGILGTPLICSDIEPYRGAPVLRLANDSALWTEAILHYAGQPQQAFTEGRELQAWVRGNWMLNDHLQEWVDALLVD